jgi:hypothetical protein
MRRGTSRTEKASRSERRHSPLFFRFSCSIISPRDSFLILAMFGVIDIVDFDESILLSLQSRQDDRFKEERSINSSMKLLAFGA